MEKKLTKISESMQKIEEAARSEINTTEDYMLVCSSLMAVTRNMYIQSLGVEDTARMFGAVADSITFTEGLLDSVRDQHKPTIH